MTFSNKSVKLVTLKNRFLMTAKAMHSIKNVFNRASCLTGQTLWLWLLFQYESVGKPCMTNAPWDITTCSLLDFLKAGLHSPKVGWIWKSLLWMLMFHRCCHFVYRNLLIVSFKSVYGMEITSRLRSKADLAAEPALSFPLTLMWLGIKHKNIFFQITNYSFK